MKFAAAVLTFFLFLPASSPAKGPPASATSLIDKAWENWHDVEDYTCVFSKQERIRGELLPERTVFMKVREDPFSVYMKWIGSYRSGQEALYVSGQNNGELKVHRGGILGIINLNLDPEGELAMKSSRHSITEAGIGHTLRLIREDFLLARKNGEGEITLVAEEDVNAPGVRCFRAEFPPERVKTGTKKESPREYYGAVSEICLDTATLLPRSVTIYDSTGELLEKYRYRDVKLNVGLTELDFDPDNPEYGF